MNNTNEQRKLFVYTIIISALTAISVFLPLFFGIGGYDAIPYKVDTGIFNMLMYSEKTVFTDYNFMICMIIAGWPTLAFGFTAVAIGITAFIRNDENQATVYKKLNLGCLICSLTYSLFGIIDMIVGIALGSYVLPLNWIYSIPVGVSFIGFMRHNASYTATENTAPTKKSKIAVLSTLVASIIVVSLTIGLGMGLGYGGERTIIKDGIIYKEGNSRELGYSGGSSSYGYIAVGSNNVTDETLIIPNSINGTRVVGIGEHAFSDLPCKEILLPGSVYAIGSYAFQHCPNLEKVVAPVSTIHNSAFYDCLSLETVATNAYEIGDDAFNSCPNLKNVIANNVKTIGNGAFSGCISLESFNFSETLESIGASAFRNTGLTSLALAKVSTIREGAFENCDNLTTVVLGQSVRTISSRAFYDCDNLVSVTIGDIAEIEDNAFGSCDKLVSITYKNYYSYSTLDIVAVLPKSITNVSDIQGTIFYMGSKEDWNKVNKVNLYGSTVYYYSYSNPYEDNPDSEDLYWHDVAGVPVVWINTPQVTE